MRARKGAPAVLRLSRETAWLVPVVGPVVIAGAAMTAAAGWFFAGSEPTAGTIVALLGLLAAATFAEAFPVPLEGAPMGVGMSIAGVFVITAGVFYGWAPAALVAVAAMAVVETLRRQSPIRIAYNVALYSLAGASTGFAAWGAERGGLAPLALGALAATAAFYLTDILLVSAAVARASRARFRELLHRSASVTAVPFSIMASFTVVLAILWDRSPALSLVLIGPLIAVALYERAVYGALARLRELDRLKDEFIAIVSHELRTPLSSVYGAAATLRQRELDEQTRGSLLSIIYRESDRLARLVDDVLWASRLESGRIETTIAPCDAAELAAEAVGAARVHLPEGFSIELTCAPSLPPLAADAAKVRQVLANMIENAVKYSPDGGRIDVGVETADGHLRFSVADQGLGIPADEQGRIFEKFHRLDPNLTRGVGGTGLGLYICRELVSQMNGRIWLTSEEGRGSTFGFDLPRADTEPAAVSAAVSAPARSGFARALRGLLSVQPKDAGAVATRPGRDSHS